MYRISLNVIGTDNARLPTRTLIEAFEKNTHFWGLTFGGCTRLLVLFGGKIHCFDDFEFWSFCAVKHDPLWMRKASQRKEFKIGNFLVRISKK